jgi:FSR family fosmidomycin resistance protein-like MFS transporter
VPDTNGWFGLHPAVFRMGATHFVSDAYSNIYAPLLPALIPRLGLSLTAAGTLAMVFQVASSVSQLGFGHVADRWKPRPLLVFGPIVAVSILSLIGLSWSVISLAFILTIGGLGLAAFHPSAAAVVQRVGGAKRGLSMSTHVTMGTIGFAIGPLMFAWFVEHVGLSWTPVLAIPGLILLAFILPRVPDMPSFTASGDRQGVAALRPYAKPLFLLYVAVVARTLTSLSFATFVPVMLTRQGWSVSQAGAAVSAYLFASGIGGFSGGPLADRFGPRRVIAISMVMATPFLLAASLRSGMGFVVLLAVAGMFLQSTLPVNITYAHQIAPVSAATVSSLMMGAAWGTGGLCVPLVGMLADHIGIGPALTYMAFLPLVGALCVIPLPPVGAHAGHGSETDAGSGTGV